MTHSSHSKQPVNFPLVQDYLGINLDADLASIRPNRLVVVESPRRLRREESYGFTRALWLMKFADRRCVVSVPTGAGSAITAVFDSIDSSDLILDVDLVEQLKPSVDRVLVEAGLPATDMHLFSLSFACNALLLKPCYCGDCCRILDASIPAAEGLHLPDHCLPNGIVYGVVADGFVVSVAYAHGVGMMKDHIADIGVETAENYRGLGYAKTVVSAVVNHIAQTGGECYYTCSLENTASIPTARSVGFVPYGSSLILAAPSQDSI